MILNACNNELFDPGRDQQRSTRYSFNVLHGIRSSNAKLEYNNSNKSNVSMLC